MQKILNNVSYVNIYAATCFKLQNLGDVFVSNYKTQGTCLSPATEIGQINIIQKVSLSGYLAFLFLFSRQR